MNYEEFKASDRHEAFLEFVSVKEAKILGIIPESFKDVFPEYCECGSEMIISTNRKTIKCCDPRCYIKMGKILAECFARFGVKNIGDATAVAITKELKEKVGYDLCVGGFLLPIVRDKWIPEVLYGARGEVYFQALTHILSRKYTLGTVIKNLSIPKLEKTAEKIFDYYPSTQILENDIRERGTLRVLCDLGIQDVKVAYYLETYFEDIKSMESIFLHAIKHVVGETISIVITGSVVPDGVVMSRKEFVEYLNDLATDSKGVQVLDFKECSAVKTAPYIVADSPSSSRKYRAGLERNVLITSTDLANIARERVKEYEQEKECDKCE